MFIRNNWYVAAWPQELNNEKPISRTLLNEQVVMYRQSDGTPVALEDRCCHRGLPLSHGEVVGDRIQCGYHGLQYNGGGACVKVPGQDLIPKSAKVRSYPLVERDQVIWIWMGDPALADQERIVPYPWHEPGSGWAHRKEHYVIRCNYELMNDNLMDLSHLGYVHKKTIGGNPEIHVSAEMKVTRSEDGVKAVRWMLDSVPPPTYTKAVATLGERVDRWQEIEYLHGLIRIYTGAVNVGVGAQQGNRDGGFGLRIFDGITPETGHSMHYFWSSAHSFDIDNPATTDLVYDQINATFQEDKAILEWQQDELSRDPARPLVDINGDVAGIQVRRLIARRLAQEAAASQPASAHSAAQAVVA
jgi:phenylpropionate dioxygenase-like ring-hydroxylating dioxygenase large terminal subunit